MRLHCVAIVAEHLRNPALCRSIPATSEDHIDLRDLCLSDVATVRGEPALCAEIVVPGFRDSCFLEVKRVTGDATLCDRIADAGLKSLCTGEPVMVE